MTEQNQHNYEHVAAMQDGHDLTVYDTDNEQAWISAKQPWEIKQ